MLVLSLSSPVWGQDPHDPEAPEATEHQGMNPTDVEAEQPEEAPAEAQASNDRAGASLRNENVFASKLDTDTQKADNLRLGGAYTIITRQPLEQKFYGGEYGNSPVDVPMLGRPTIGDSWHGEVFESLQNSVFNARTFFQSGPVKPSRMNQYGARFTGRLPGWGFLTGSFGQNKTRGMVNGNALVPLPSERTPLATDPTSRAIVEHFLAAYPVEQPNRTDIDPRALNTNAPQSIDSINANLRLDGKAGQKGMLSLFHDFNRQTIKAFQLVAGQNPDTALHSQKSRATYRLSLSDATEISFGGNFTRVRSDLHPEPRAVGPRVRLNNAIDTLGPGGQYPLNRAENTFRYGAMGTHRFSGGRHRITFGGELSRYHLNGFEQNGTRGDYSFANNFGRSSIENLLLGVPTSYTIRIGNHYRGFRTWSTEAYFGDEWNVTQNFQLHFGVRHSMTTVPVEVNNLNALPYDRDGNNFGPRVSFAYRGPKDWIARGSYAVAFGDIFPVTYSQSRYNAPAVITLIVNNPYLGDPLAGFDLNSRSQRSSLYRFDPNLTTPYTHQYSFTLERAFGPVTLDFAYLGSRSIKVLAAMPKNRAYPVPGMPIITANINDRRPDPRYFEITEVGNAGIAWLDAAQFAWRLRPFHGFTGGGTYTWSKALDQGAMYNSTAANNDLNTRGQSEFNSLQDQKGFSQFDSPHALSIFGAQQTPGLKRMGKVISAIAGSWQISGVLVAKKGTPFNVTTGADAPGFGNVDGIGSDRPNIVNPSIINMTVGNPETSTEILNPAFFSNIKPGELAGNLARNSFRKGAIVNVNASVAREWHFSGSRPTILRFQGDAYNLTNHPQFDEPQNQTSSPSFGKITNTLNNGRVLQFGMRLIF
ncbi:MAG: hypothetical protein ABL967_07820 [Bryobacteraceae bacterium]